MLGEHNAALYPLAPLCRWLGRRQRERSRVTAWACRAPAAGTPARARDTASATARPQEGLGAASTQPLAPTVTPQAQSQLGTSCPKVCPNLGEQWPQLMAPRGQDASQLPRHTSASHTSFPGQQFHTSSASSTGSSKSEETPCETPGCSRNQAAFQHKCRPLPKLPAARALTGFQEAGDICCSLGSGSQGLAVVWGLALLFCGLSFRCIFPPDRKGNPQKQETEGTPKCAIFTIFPQFYERH